MPCIKVRKNARVRPKTNYILRNLSVISQRNDLQKWKNDVNTYLSILQIMSAFSNGETEITEVTYGTENTSKIILEFLSRANKIWIFMQIISGPLFRWDLMNLSEQCKIK